MGNNRRMAQEQAHNVEQGQDRSLGKTIVQSISNIFLPVVNVITASSIIKSVLLLLISSGVLDKQSGIYLLFYGASDGFFYFLPFFLAVTASKEWRADPFVSMLIPCAMLYPDVVAVLETGGQLSFATLTVPNAVYHSSVIPVLLSVGLLHFVEIPCDKLLPSALKGFLKPIVCLIIVIPATFLLFGPIGTAIGDVLAAVFFRIYSWSAVAAGAFMGFVCQPMVAVGAHWAVVPAAINSIATKGFDVIMPFFAGAVYAQGGAVLAVAFMYKRGSEKHRLALQASATAVLGVSEPALFGFNIPLALPFASACLAGTVGGALIGWAGTTCKSFAFPSIVTSVAFAGQGFGTFLLSMVICYALGFALTFAQRTLILCRLSPTG